MAINSPQYVLKREVFNLPTMLTQNDHQSLLHHMTNIWEMTFNEAYAHLVGWDSTINTTHDHLDDDIG